MYKNSGRSYKISYAKRMLYFLLAFYALFHQIVCVMADKMMEPTLLPLKIIGGIFAILLMLYVVGILIAKKKTDGKIKNTQTDSGVEDTNTDKFDKICTTGSVLILVVAFLMNQQYYLNGYYEALGTVNSVKITGLILGNANTMLAYYLEELLHIPANITLAILLPLFLLLLVWILLYESATVLCGTLVRKKGLMLLVETVVLSMSDCACSYAGIVFHGVLSADGIAFVILPMLTFLLVFLYCKNENSGFEKGGLFECVGILILALLLSKAVFAICMMEIFVGVIYVVIRGYLLWIQSSKS